MNLGIRCTYLREYNYREFWWVFTGSGRMQYGSLAVSISTPSMEVELEKDYMQWWLRIHLSFSWNHTFLFLPCFLPDVQAGMRFWSAPRWKFDTLFVLLVWESKYLVFRSPLSLSCTLIYWKSLDLRVTMGNILILVQPFCSDFSPVALLWRSRYQSSMNYVVCCLPKGAAFGGPDSVVAGSWDAHGMG